ncbi:high-potential iron-sulfur protein [Paraburkholderia fynbosensis]|uniref:high-potential iron-sulfur protein n=1 Tax=Paraburkholderia fynbosensis TaxID=1200993 RepID=UPI001FED13C3|nr:high-potential iron-sulfur protein [Paraburkholderia fynbosensis]
MAWAAPTQLQESDPAAQALGYRTDASRVDYAKYSRFSGNQRCSNCQFYQGKPTDASARYAYSARSRCAARDASRPTCHTRTSTRFCGQGRRTLLPADVARASVFSFLLTLHVRAGQ